MFPAHTSSVGKEHANPKIICEHGTDLLFYLSGEPEQHEHAQMHKKIDGIAQLFLIRRAYL